MCELSDGRRPVRHCLYLAAAARASEEGDRSVQLRSLRLAGQVQQGTGHSWERAGLEWGARVARGHLPGPASALVHLLQRGLPRSVPALGPQERQRGASGGLGGPRTVSWVSKQGPCSAKGSKG